MHGNGWSMYGSGGACTLQEGGAHTLGGVPIREGGYKLGGGGARQEGGAHVSEGGGAYAWEGAHMPGRKAHTHRGRCTRIGGGDVHA